MRIRTRMAPSPTGEFHIGGMRTLLFNYAWAKKNGGKFVLRIEDTDREREVEGAVDRILQVIKDYGLGWDEGPIVGGPHEPYIQSQRLEIYQKYAKQLVEQGHAYYCFCTKERLEELRQQQRDAKMPSTKYDKHCLSLTAEEVKDKLAKSVPSVIRLNVKADQTVGFTDAILGPVNFPTNDVDDQVLLKSDGFPTYHLAVVVDDHLMEINCVMRGLEWLASTPKHLLLYQAFGWELPTYAHLPLLKDKDATKKLSKRLGSVASVEFLREGYLPRALLNFLMLTGWHPSTDKELYSLEEFIKDFSIDRITSTDLVVFDREKLLWFNGYYIRNTQTHPLWHEIKSWAKKFDNTLNGVAMPDDFNFKVLDLVKDRMQTLNDFNMLTHYFYVPPVVDRIALETYTGSWDRTSDILRNFHQLFKSVSESDWNSPQLDKLAHEMLTQKEYQPKEAFMTLRLAVTAESSTPPIFDILGVLGKVDVLDRIFSAYK
jgi:glutamyl-tRNA synthetase